MDPEFYQGQVEVTERNLDVMRSVKVQTLLKDCLAETSRKYVFDKVELVRIVS